ncbi:MAG: hypothetical protein OXQ28_01940 [Acidobacteriota bacterium]|nr:hypothetical protein [Acidobacteriota bacterium]
MEAAAEFARCAGRDLIAGDGYVRIEVPENDPASTGRPLHLPVDRMGLTRQNAGHDGRAPGTSHDLAELREPMARMGVERLDARSVHPGADRR